MRIETSERIWWWILLPFRLPTEYADVSPISFYLLCVYIWNRDKHWLVLGAVALLVEYGAISILTDRRRYTQHAQIRRCVFDAYKDCRFIELPVYEYFRNELEVLTDALKHIKIHNVVQQLARGVLTAYFGEDPFAPRTFMAIPKARPDGQRPTAPKPTFYRTADGGWIFSTENPGRPSVKRKFDLVHEIGHAVYQTDPDWKAKKLLRVVTVAIAMPILLKVSWVAAFLYFSVLIALRSDFRQRFALEWFDRINVEVAADAFAIERIGFADSRMLGRLYGHEYLRNKAWMENCDRATTGELLHRSIFSRFDYSAADYAVVPLLFLVASRPEFQRFDMVALWVPLVAGLAGLGMLVRALFGELVIFHWFRTLREYYAPMSAYLPISIAVSHSFTANRWGELAVGLDDKGGTQSVFRAGLNRKARKEILVDATARAVRGASPTSAYEVVESIFCEIGGIFGRLNVARVGGSERQGCLYVFGTDNNRLFWFFFEGLQYGNDWDELRRSLDEALLGCAIRLSLRRKAAPKIW